MRIFVKRPAYPSREHAKDFTQAAMEAGFTGRGILSVLFMPALIAAFRPAEKSGAWVFALVTGFLMIWWLGTLLLAAPTRYLWRSRRPGFMRHAAPLLLSLALALGASRLALMTLLFAADRLNGTWSLLFRALAAWGALLFGQGLCIRLLPCLRPGRVSTALAIVALALFLALDLAALLA